MAESFLFSIAESLISKLASPAYEEVSRVLGLYDNLNNLKDTLLLVQAVLLDADQKQEQNHELQEWLRQLKRVFYDAEDVLDEFECETLRKQVLKAHGTTKDKVGHFFSSSNPLVFRHRMAHQIKDVSMRLDKVAADRHKFCLQTIDVDTRVVHRREMTHSHVTDSDVIGREQDKGEIIQLLMHQNPDDRRLSVIPIVGMGGLGKTTLAKFVFNDKRIQECFPLKMWVCVSNDFDVKQVIIKIINSANDSVFLPGVLDRQQKLNEMDLEQLQNLMRNKLAGQKFLLVLDDVWNEEQVKWVELKNLIQVGAAAGSKILVTTRNHSIADMMGTGTVPSHDLKCLSPEESLSLFVKWAFKEGEAEKYPHLVNIGREIVIKCKGVPLAVRTLGSLLFLKFDANEWESVRNNEILNLSQKKDDILPALKLSYDLMPSYLRQCFALFSLYPKDYIFSSITVSLLWRSLGLLSSPENNRSLEDVAHQYLDALLSRSFLQDFVNYGTYYTFEIHDLMHDLAQFVAKDESLLVNSHIESIPENVRHLSFVETGLLGKSLTTKSVGVRTIIFPIAGVGANGDAFFVMVSRYKYLKILDLSNSSFETLPHSVGKLKHLRYLSLCHNKKIKRLPDSICKFQNLQSLWLRGCTNLKTLPRGLTNLISLRDFKITTKQAVLPEKEIANLSSLLEILNVEYCYNVESLMLLGIEFPILRTLTLTNCTSLKSLPLDSKHFPALELLFVSKCGKLELSKDHEDQNFNLKLKTIIFVSLPQLGILPHWLQGTVNTLQSLTLRHCHNLEVLPEWLPMLTCLRTLVIVDCPRLQSLPDSIHCLAALEYLEIDDCPELCRIYKPQVGECWNQISHIKKIKIW